MTSDAFVQLLMVSFGVLLPMLTLTEVMFEHWSWSCDPLALEYCAATGYAAIVTFAWLWIELCGLRLY